MKKTMSLKRPFTSRRSLSLFLCATLVGTFLTSGLQHTSANAATTVLTGQTYDAYTPLKEVYKDYFNMGIFGSGEMNASIYNFDTFTPGNAMKPESTQNVKGTFTYSTCDDLFGTYSALNPNINFYGHTLAWHSQTPSWMWDDSSSAAYGQPGTFDKATALANLNNHIDNVLGHFGGKLKGMDVVNEAVQTANPSDWKASLAPQGCWYNALGSEWVEDAFLEAAKVVDANGWDCKLRYNDFGLDSTTKAQTVYAMVKDINERYAGVRPNGKPLIEVIGMQAHYDSTTSTVNVESAINLFATLPGVKVNITESDVGAPPVGALTSVNESNQAVEWAKLFQIYKKYASGSANTTSNPKVIDRVDICGVRDVATSGWRAGEFALLFDSNGLAKQALLGVLDPDTFLATHQYVDPNNGAAIAHLDGVYVYSKANGDAYTGANIILGTDSTQWPWSTAGADGKVAFTPEKDARYRLTLNYTSAGTSAIRVRWVKDGTNGGYTTADSSASNLTANIFSSSQTADKIPAYFKTGMVAAGSYTLIDEFKMDSAQMANGLIGNLAIRGGSGGNAYTINWIKVEKINTGVSDTLLVNWPTLETSTAATVAAGITSVVAPAKDATSLTMPTVPSGFTIGIKSATSTTAAIALDGTITPPTNDTTVAMTFLVTKTADSTTASTISINVVVPAKTVVTPSAATVAAGITSVVAPAKDATSLTMPTVPSGFTIGIKSATSTIAAIALDGTITPPTNDTTVAMTFLVTKTADSTTASTISINVVVPAKTVVTPPPLTVVNETPVDHFTLGSDAKIKVKVKNNLAQSQNVALLVGLFNNNNTMLAYGASQQSIGINNEVELEVMLTMPSSGNYTVRYFVWDSLENHKALDGVSPVDIPVQ